MCYRPAHACRDNEREMIMMMIARNAQFYSSRWPRSSIDLYFLTCSAITLVKTLYCLPAWSGWCKSTDLCVWMHSYGSTSALAILFCWGNTINSWNVRCRWRDVILVSYDVHKSCSCGQAYNLRPRRHDWWVMTTNEMDFILFNAVQYLPVPVLT